MTNTQPRRSYSDKLESLLNFLDLEENGENDSRTPSSTRAGAGLVDITNTSLSKPCEEEKANKDGQQTSKLLVNNDKKKSYIWDDWGEEATQNGETISLEPKTSSGGGEKSCAVANVTLPANMQKQLAELKAMSDEIQTKAAAMKIELEHKTDKVEELHSIRVKHESEHVERMKAIQREGKKRMDAVKGEHERIVTKQDNLISSLTKDCEALEQKIVSIKADIERTTKSEQDICARLKRDGAQALEDAKRSWNQAEKKELQKRDIKMSPKLKRDAAKAVEPRLYQMMEMNKEDLERLEREAARELDFHKLELFKRSNDEYRREISKIRAEERDCVSRLQDECLGKLEHSRREHEEDLKKVREEYSKMSDMMKQQFNADKQSCIDDHEAEIFDVRQQEKMEMELIQARHEREMTDMEDKYSDEMVQHRRTCQEELKQWKVTREAELQVEEDNKLKDECTKLKSKVQAEVELVKKRLKDEQAEKMREVQSDRDEMMAAIQSKHDVDVSKLQGVLQEAIHESAITRLTLETEELEQLQQKLASMKKAVHEKEDDIITQQRRLASHRRENEQQLLDNQQKEKRRIAQSRHEKISREEELDKLIAACPKQQEVWARELEALRKDNTDEVALAESKVNAMLQNKQSVLEVASAKLFQLQQDVVNIDRHMDEARRKNVLGGES